MKTYAVFDPEGLPQAFYREDLWTPDQLPANAIQIAEADWREFLENPGRRKWDGTQVVPYDPPAIDPVPPRSVAMWRARTIAKVTPHGDGTLFDAVSAYIEQMTDPLQKAAAEEAWARGDVFDREGVFVPMIATALGIDEPTLDALMAQAAALPA